LPAPTDHHVAVIGGGPAGLMAAEAATASGARVELYDAMPSVGRKFLLAGKGGLNLTHSEDPASFLARYGDRGTRLRPLIAAFDAAALRAWAHGLGVETFVGSSGRVFPAGMKAAPLLRAWLHRLRANGVRFHMRHRWRGWSESGALRFETAGGPHETIAGATVLALGGGSWARLGSDAAWVPLLAGRGIDIAPLSPSNCGFEAAWSEHLRSRHAGQPVKPAIVTLPRAGQRALSLQGELILTAYGVEGGVIYALSAAIRDEIARHGSATVRLDLAPGRDAARLAEALARPRGSHTLATHLRRCAGIEGAKSALLREILPASDFRDPARLAAAIKALPVTLVAPRPIDEAISTAGGVRFEELDGNLMLTRLPGVFCAGEMLDWEAPTGGYLLTACFASGRAAGIGAAAWLQRAR
jgi:uncharacterized flavoprotein (TIGR03862 family)